MMQENEFRELNKAKGFHWFSKNTMRFFKTRVSNWDYVSGYFITSEKPPYRPRKYSIRRANFETGRVDSVGEFNAYATLRQAKSKLRGYQRYTPPLVKE